MARAVLATALLGAPLRTAAQEPSVTAPPPVAGIDAVRVTFDFEPGGPELYDAEQRDMIEAIVGGQLQQRLEDLGLGTRPDAGRLHCAFRFAEADDDRIVWSYRVSLRGREDDASLWTTEGRVSARPGAFGSIPNPVVTDACLGAFRAAHETVNPPGHGLELVAEVGSDMATGDFGSVAVAGGRFYLVRNAPRPPGARTRRGAVNIRIVDPERPGGRGGTDVELPDAVAVAALDVVPPLAYALAFRGGAPTPVLQVLDLSDPGAPELLGSHQVDAAPGSWTSLAIAGSRAVLSFSRGTPANRNVTVDVELIDLDDPSDPDGLGRLELPAGSDNIGDIAVAGRLVLLAARGSGLYIFDAEGPAAPELLATYAPGSWARGVVVHGARAYLSVSTTRNVSQVHVLDISDPRDPVLVRELDTVGPAQRMALMDGRLYVADHTSGLAVYDVRAPDGPELLGRFVPGRLARTVPFIEVAAADGLVATWGPSGSVWLLRVAPDAGPIGGRAP